MLTSYRFYYVYVLVCKNIPYLLFFLLVLTIMYATTAIEQPNAKPKANPTIKLFKTIAKTTAHIKAMANAIIITIVKLFFIVTLLIQSNLNHK